MIKYIFFDWGYTLIDSFENVDAQINEILKPFNKNWNDIFKTWRNYHYLHSLGRITKEEKLKQISLLTNIPVNSLEQISKLLLDSHVLSPKIKETIELLHQKGYKLGIISNNIDEDVRFILERENVSSLFEVVVCSSGVGERKPSAKIFLKAFENIPQKDYNKILFVSDELSEDIIGAIALGTKTAWVCKNTVNAWKKAEPEIFETDYKIESVTDLKNIL
jgi:FMN phosphatase YigB (HAD superfamily)